MTGDFWDLVDRGGVGDGVGDACWMWTGGDGELMWEGQRDYCWRVAWKLAGDGGELGSETFLLRVCGEGLCCNPSHMTVKAAGGVGIRERGGRAGGALLDDEGMRAVAEMWTHEFPVRDIAAAVGVSRHVVARAVERLGLKRRFRYASMGTVVRGLVLWLWDSGWEVWEIALVLRVRESAVEKLVGCALIEEATQ